MLIVVLDYGKGSIHFHRIPEELEDAEDVEEYIDDNLGYDISMINWMEIRC
jgi:hypothetical protein